MNDFDDETSPRMTRIVYMYFGIYISLGRNLWTKRVINKGSAVGRAREPVIGDDLDDWNVSRFTVEPSSCRKRRETFALMPQTL